MTQRAAIGISRGDVVVRRLRPPGAGPLGAGLGQRAPDRMHDLMGDEDGIHRHRRGRARIHDGALGRNDLDAAVGALVAGDGRIEE